MKRIHACLLILVFAVFAVSAQDDEICSANLFSSSNSSSNERLFAVRDPIQTDYDSCLATVLDQLFNAHITEVWFLRIEVTAGMAYSAVPAPLSHRDVTVHAGRAPPATLAVTV
ncbi:MAG TPA: hypothetical protein VE422_15165 [Terriglobia bacterium]|nr:hypothetical protein [Terriglobia bacterium]